MALFKVLRGDRANLDAYGFHDGYAYFCSDTGEFFIDCVNSFGEETRKQLKGGAQAQIIEWDEEDLSIDSFCLSYVNCEMANLPNPMVSKDTVFFIPKTFQANNLTYTITKIGNYIVAGKTKEITVNIPDTIQEISYDEMWYYLTHRELIHINFEGTEEQWAELCAEAVNSDSGDIVTEEIIFINVDCNTYYTN